MTNTRGKCFALSTVWILVLALAFFLGVNFLPRMGGVWSGLTVAAAVLFAVCAVATAQILVYPTGRPTDIAQFKDHVPHQIVASGIDNYTTLFVVKDLTTGTFHLLSHGVPPQLAGLTKFMMKKGVPTAL
jgi:hypothetical protein